MKEATKIQKTRSKFQRRVNGLKKIIKTLYIKNQLRKIQNIRDKEFIEILKELDLEAYEKVKEEVKKRGLSRPKLKELKKRMKKD